MTDPSALDADKAHADIGIVCALPMEIAPLLERCLRVRKYSGGSFTFRGGLYDEIRVAIVEAGMGFALARRATQALLDAHTPRWVLACGFSGALRPEMKIGQIVMANSICDTHGQELSVDVRMPADPRRGLHVGRILTADNIVRGVKDKEALAAEFGAIAVDMESLAVAQVCRDTKTRFLAVRVISDDLSADLPPEILSVMGSTGTVRLGAAIGSLWRRPGSAKDMWKLRENARLAAEKLATFLNGVLVQLHETA
jgi:adenosylhomocysteine nucleosidase